MRKLMMAVAATAVLASAELFTDARPANAQSVSQDALKAAFDSGDLHVSYVRRGGGGGRGGSVGGSSGGPRGVAYPGDGGRGAWSIAVPAVEVLSPIALAAWIWSPRLWPSWLWTRLWPPWLSPGLRRRLLWQPVLWRVRLWRRGTRACHRCCRRQRHRSAAGLCGSRLWGRVGGLLLPAL